MNFRVKNTLKRNHYYTHKHLLNHTSILARASQQINNNFYFKCKKNIKRDFKCLGSGGRVKPNSLVSGCGARARPIILGSCCRARPNILGSCCRARPNNLGFGCEVPSIYFLSTVWKKKIRRKKKKSKETKK